MVELKITLDQETGVQVAGPIQDKILCLGLLEIAKNIIVNFKQEEQPTIIQAKAIVPNV